MNNLPSQFLPEDFDSQLPIAVVAGQRDYPILTVEAIRRTGLPVRLIALKGETDEHLTESFPESERDTIKVGQIGKMLKAMKRMKVGYAIFVGQVTPGKLFRDLTPDIKALSLLAKLKERNAHSIFGAICNEINAINVTMLDARSFLDDSLASEGLMTSNPSKTNRDYLDHGIRIATEVSRLDIGQGIVVRKGTVISVEGFEGTDEMLSRANKYKTDQLIFVKTSKPNHNPYFDWPVFGDKTLQVMINNGIKTAALETNSVIMLNKKSLIEKANKAGIELLGYTKVN